MEIVNVQEITKIVREGAKLFADRDFKITQKGNDSNYVTERDVAVEEFLRSRLTSLLEGSQVVGEEGEKSAVTSRFVWVIDPIDGTSNFIRGMYLSVISVGLLVDGQPYIGVVYNPYTDEMFWAETGKGAYLNGERIHVSERDFAHGHLCSAMSLYDKRYAPPCFKIIEQVYARCDDLRRLGCAALELVYLACGRVELYFEIRVFPWDAAGAVPIIREAGGFVKVLYTDEFPTDRPFPIYAANTKESFEKLEGIVKKEIPVIPY